MRFRHAPPPIPSPAGSSPLDRPLTSWDQSSDREYRDFVKQAARAGAKAIPDPSRCTDAPSCFEAVANKAADRIHHELCWLVEETAEARLIIAANADAGPFWSAGTISEAEERRLIEIRLARETISIAVDRVLRRIDSIVAVYRRTSADMKQAYRAAWPYDRHFDQLVFPELRLEDIRYGERAGFSAADLLPTPAALDPIKLATRKQVLP